MIFSVDNYNESQLSKYWRIIGIVLLCASVAQPIVSYQLKDLSPDELLAPISIFLGGETIPAEISDLFAGVFANIEFAFAFALVKLGLGTLIFFAARSLRTAKWPVNVLQGASILGMAAFIGIGLYFTYASYVIVKASEINVFIAIMMSLMGLVTASIPALWLYRNFKSLQAIKRVAPRTVLN